MSMSRPRTPRDLVAAVEARPVLPDGTDERFSGYAVLGVHFASGEILALRRFAASSVGPAYASVWHYSASARWTMYQDIPEAGGCGRYFSDGVERVVVCPIRIVWTGASRFTVTVEDGPLDWQVQLASAWTTRLLSDLAGALPRSLVSSGLGARILGRAAGLLLGAGALTLTGSTPNGFRFLASATALYHVGGSRALIAGRATGEAVASARDIHLGDFRIPSRGIFAMVSANLRAAADGVAGSSGI
jgi:hypothetical protein